MLSEFDLIARYFTRPKHAGKQVALGIGDDCALLRPSAGMQIAISSDMLVEGRHFFPDTNPYQLAHKCLAVNLSDLAAMGAKPVAFTLALSLPQATPTWLADFSAGLFALADAHDCALIGGDTTKGPLTICITIFGEIPTGQALLRSAAQVGDDIWVSGTLGDAKLALAIYQNELNLDSTTLADAAIRLHTPTPRVTLGLALRDVARAAIDISDGLAGDLMHILHMSKVGATLDVDTLPFGANLTQHAQALRYQYALTGGDDYELCFTAPPTQRDAVLAAAHNTTTPVTRIGVIEATPGLRLVNTHGPIVIPGNSFDHFLSA